MTFGDLLTDLRSRKLNEATQNFFGDSSDLLPMLSQAERWIASIFAFPRVVTTGTVSASANSISIPSDMMNIAPDGLLIDGLKLRRVGLADIEFYRQASAGRPGYFAWDAASSSPTAIQLAPTNDTTARPYRLEYVKRMPETRATTDNPWDNLFREYHDAISIMAAVYAYEKGPGTLETANYWRARAKDRLTEFAVYLRGLGHDVPPNAVEMAVSAGAPGGR